jgi:hypothetical protein
LFGFVTFSQACSNENYQQEVQQLKRQLQIATEERNELEVYITTLTCSCLQITIKFSNAFLGSENARKLLNCRFCLANNYLLLASSNSQQ